MLAFLVYLQEGPIVRHTWILLFLLLIYLFVFLACCRNLKDIHGKPYFTNYLDVFFSLYVLTTTANNPDVMYVSSISYQSLVSREIRMPPEGKKAIGLRRLSLGGRGGIGRVWHCHPLALFTFCTCNRMYCQKTRPLFAFDARRTQP